VEYHSYLKVSVFYYKIKLLQLNKIKILKDAFK